MLGIIATMMVSCTKKSDERLILTPPSTSDTTLYNSYGSDSAVVDVWLTQSVPGTFSVKVLNLTNDTSTVSNFDESVLIIMDADTVQVDQLINMVGRIAGDTVRAKFTTFTRDTINTQTFKYFLIRPTTSGVFDTLVTISGVCH